MQLVKLYLTGKQHMENHIRFRHQQMERIGQQQRCNRKNGGIDTITLTQVNARYSKNAGC